MLANLVLLIVDHLNAGLLFMVLQLWCLQKLKILPYLKPGSEDGTIISRIKNLRKKEPSPLLAAAAQLRLLESPRYCHP